MPLYGGRSLGQACNPQATRLRLLSHVMPEVKDAYVEALEAICNRFAGVPVQWGPDHHLALVLAVLRALAAKHSLNVEPILVEFVALVSQRNRVKRLFNASSMAQKLAANKMIERSSSRGTSEM